MSNNNVSTWRTVLAAILDFLTAFIGFGVLIAFFTGGLKSNGFNLSGWPALCAIVLIVLYFWIGNKYLGGTLWKRILKAVKR